MQKEKQALDRLISSQEEQEKMGNLTPAGKSYLNGLRQANKIIFGEKSISISHRTAYARYVPISGWVAQMTDVKKFECFPIKKTGRKLKQGMHLVGKQTPDGFFKITSIIKTK